MNNLLQNTTALAQYVCQGYIDRLRASAAGEPLIAVDGTCGQGFDTLWLAERCDAVYGFDIQEEAIRETRQRLEEAGAALSEKTVLICGSHEALAEHVGEEPRMGIIVFNLGYLPGHDKTVTTEAETTLKALEEARKLLRVGGLLSVTMYWGHPAGKAEREAVLSWAKTLDKGTYHCVHTDMVNQPNCPPEVLFVTRKR